MPKKHYSWNNGPAVIDQHSVAKHRILESYLAEYFRTLVSSPHQDELRLTLVDGFAGGGVYHHRDTRELLLGSPFICLNATKEAELYINQDRKKPVVFKVSYFFIEAERSAAEHLKHALVEREYGHLLNDTIFLKQAPFQDEVNGIIAYIRKKSPRNGRSIFVLDQYGYKEVPTSLIRKIFQNLPSAEVILTFGVDALLNYASDAMTQRLLDQIGLPEVLQGKTFQEIKESEKDWRLYIQSALYAQLVGATGARHYTPFFIRTERGHGDYWLVHLSQHPRARDVMTQVHWRNSNHFIHYGGPGLDMFQMVGYDPRMDSAVKGQSEFGFCFDNIARDMSVQALMTQIPRLVYAHDAGMSFGELYVATCNGSPASADIYREATGRLVALGELEVRSPDGTSRRSPQQISNQDQIVAPKQSRFIF